LVDKSNHKVMQLISGVLRKDYFWRWLIIHYQNKEASLVEAVRI
jgi:hypothetical protein